MTKQYLLSTWLLSAMFSALFALANIAQAETRFAIVGTGGVTGVYYPAGGAVCRMVNRLRQVHGIRCAVESTQGSIYNLTKLRERDLDLAVVQADWHHHSAKGSADFSEQGADGKLRSLFSLHTEAFTLVARADANINSLADLKGKRINIGNPGSGQRATMQVLMERLGWTLDDFTEVFEYKSADQSEHLCKGTFDAMVFVAGHPSASIKEATTACDSKLIPVLGDPVASLVANNDYYNRIVIPGGMYRGNHQAIETFGVGATFVSSSDLDEELVYEVVKGVFENFETFRKLHPAFANLNKKAMLENGLTAPFHAGALKYYQEARMIDVSPMPALSESEQASIAEPKE